MKFSNFFVFLHLILIYFFYSCGSTDVNDNDLDLEINDEDEIICSYTNSNYTNNYSINELNIINNSAVYEIDSNTRSFIVSVKGVNPKITSIIRPDSSNVLELVSGNGNDKYSSFRMSYSDYMNFQIPIDKSLTLTQGSWSITTTNASSAKIVSRSGNLSHTPKISVRPFITGNKFQSSDIISTLDKLKLIYSKSGIDLSIDSITKVSSSEYTILSTSFTNYSTSKLLETCSEAGKVNIFFIEDFYSSGSIGISAGIPGSQGVKGNRNGVLVNLNSHVSGGKIDDQLLAETAGHEMGHFLGLFHTTESNGIDHDPISDTPECSFTTANQCGKQYGADNLMFWSSWANGNQDNLTEGQVYVLKRALIAK